MEEEESKFEDPDDDSKSSVSVQLTTNAEIQAAANKLKAIHAKPHHAKGTQKTYKKWSNNFALSCGVNNLRWKLQGRLPPKKYLTDDHFENFFARIWATLQKPAIEQARSFLNWALKENGLPAMTYRKHIYRKTHNFIENIKKENKWRHYQKTKAAKALPKEVVQQLMTSPIRNDDGEIQLDWLRDKVISGTFIHCGYHPADTARMKLGKLEDMPENRDLNGYHRPIIKINIKKTKQHHKNIVNWISCGCNEDHDPENENCEYSLMKLLLGSLPGEFAGKSLWWNTCKNAWTQNQGDNGMAKKTVANAMERINKRCDISESKLKGFQGRKTMATMGRNLFSIDNTMIQAVGNWEDPKEIEDYVDP